MKAKEMFHRCRELLQGDRAFAHMIAFFLGMLLLTLIARGTSGVIMARVEVTVPVQHTFPGDDGEMTEYGSCVPLSALHQDADGYFVFVYTQEVTIWGIENSAVRVDVDVAAMDYRYAALSGALGKDSKVISDSNKPLNDGDRVRVVS